MYGSQLPFNHIRSQNSSVGIGLGGPKFRTLASASDFSQKCTVGLWSPPTLLLNGYRGSFPGEKQLESDVNHTPPYYTKIKSLWSYTSTPLHVFMVWKRKSFTFYVHINIGCGTVFLCKGRVCLILQAARVRPCPH
jgi:hypothetical protein